jgi:hypothetical protein
VLQVAVGHAAALEILDQRERPAAVASSARGRYRLTPTNRSSRSPSAHRIFTTGYRAPLTSISPSRKSKSTKYGSRDREIAAAIFE